MIRNWAINCIRFFLWHIIGSTSVDESRLGQIFLLVDLREFFFRFKVGETKKANDHLTGHFQSFFSFLELF